ncbi:TIM barrel protein [Marivita sp. GX14005]|uniref:hydroxypyruvate isomerase family protein n=1 Tax=Marivita sp. GX14005 TaxID=2942276 RepID=UPI002018AA71|nr:TIM barrel protein [Marivita sp. GX14005]MCL3882949.1 TIM barrel protein [Marivita sp. GX14005]
MDFSANLGMLWANLPLPDAIRRAKAAGFAAVECHWPYPEDAGAVRDALMETGLPMLGINTRKGDAGEFGLCAVPGRESGARASIDEALGYAAQIGAQAVHVMAGKAQGAAAREVFLGNLRYGLHAARELGITLLIEPLNVYDAPGYFLRSTDQAARIIEEVGDAHLRLMFDCYHVQITEGDVSRRLTRLLPHIGHVQIAAVPDRGAPDHGELDYAHVLRHLAGLGWTRPVGAEYRPEGATEESLGWMDKLKAS